MNLYSKTEKSAGTDDDSITPKHYNWLLMLAALIIYLIASLSF